MADDWDLPLGADARSLSSKECKYDTWDDDYESIHNTSKSNCNAVDSSRNTGNLIHNTVDEYEGWIPAKTKSSRKKEAATNSWKDEKQHFNEGKRNNSKHSQKKNKTKYNPPANNHDTWNTYEDDNPTSREWNFTNNSGYAQASAPVVNVWEQRIKRSEAIKSMEPVNETEEEAMIRRAIELSKLEAQKDEENQKKLAKEYELQMQLLASNPEIVADISEAFVDIPPNNPSTLESTKTSNDTSNGYRRERKTEEIPKNAVYNRNEKKSMDYGGAKPKFGKIIEAFGGWGIKEDVHKTHNESNDFWEEPDEDSYHDKVKPNDCWDEPERNNYKTTKGNSSSEHCVAVKPHKKQSSRVWDSKDVVKNPDKSNDRWDEPNKNIYDAKTESNDCWGESDKNDYGVESTEENCLPEHSKMEKPLKKQSSRRKNVEAPSYTETCEDYVTDASDLVSSRKNEKKHSKENDDQCEQFFDAKSDFSFFPSKEAETLYSWDEVEKDDNFPEHSDVNLKVSKDSDERSSKKAIEFDEFIQELKKDSDDSTKEMEENNLVNNGLWEDTKSVQFSNSNWENSDHMVGSDNSASNEGKSYNLFSSDGFDSLSISSLNKPDKLETQSSHSFPETSNCSNVATYNTNEFLFSSDPNNAADQNLLTDDISESSRYGDFQVNQGQEINAEQTDVYNPFTFKMSSDSKQTLVESGHLNTEDQANILPTSNFIPVEENPVGFQTNPALNQTSSPYLPNMPIGTPLMPMTMPLSPNLMSPYTNPILLQQMLMLNNPFFVKQLQALDMYYRSMGMPMQMPFAPMQMPLASSLPDPNFLANQNQVPTETEQSMPHDLLFPNQREVPERLGAVPKPPGLNDFIRTEKQMDTLQQAEINSFLDKYCDNNFENEVPPIPPPKPATTECSDSSNSVSESSALGVASGDPFCIAPQKNVNVMQPSTKTYGDLASLNVKQDVLQKESFGWGDLDDGTSARQRRKKYMWSEEVDGWGNESTTKPVKKSSNMETKNKPMNRQPSSQPLVGRYKP